MISSPKVPLSMTHLTIESKDVYLLKNEKKAGLIIDRTLGNQYIKLNSVLSIKNMFYYGQGASSFTLVLYP